MKKKIYFVLVAFILSMAIGYAGAPKTQVKKTKKLTSQAYSQDKHDANVKSRDVSSKEETKKGKNRACAIYVNNHRGYYVEVYIDGYYYGTVAPYGAYTFYPGDGWTSIYCETTNGLLWWSDSGSCYSWNSFDLW